MMKHALALFALLGPLYACNDDTAITARAQSLVNRQLDTSSSVEVDVHDGHATLSGMVSNDEIRIRAIQAAQSVDGIKSVDDTISTLPSLTGATVPR